VSPKFHSKKQITGKPEEIPDMKSENSFEALSIILIPSSHLQNPTLGRPNELETFFGGPRKRISPSMTCQFVDGSMV